ncbi:MAG: glycosyltransferase family 4 protein [Promethearchaeota archaeon]
MNIALITNDFLPIRGGITNVMINLSKKLTEQGEKIFIFNKTCHNEDKLYFKILSNDNSLSGIIIHNFKFLYFLIYLFFKIIFSFKEIKLKDKLKLAFFYCFYLKFIVRRIISIKNLVSYFNRFKIDIILSGTSGIPLLYSFILSKWFNIPIVSIAHGDDFLFRYPFKIKTYIFQNIEKIVVTNKIMKNLFLKIYNINSNKIFVIHLGVDIKNSIVDEPVLELRTKFNISPNDFIILTVSRLYPRKGFDTVLKAIKLIIDEDPSIPIKYLIIGGGEEQKNIESLISKLKLEHYVRFLGNVNDYLKNQYYKLSDLFILVPQLNKHSIEGFGIVYIEANYFKLPVIGSRTGGVRIAILDGKTGFLIKPRDVLHLKEKILFLYNNEKIRTEMGNYGYERVIKVFNWDKIALIYQELFNNTIKQINNKHKNR